ncbi:MAG TPA: PGPGW domain-containing protein [Syntrophales bacterium]|nr:PGPGW domain-containing protein [Syntrophales bacterium]
MKRSSEGREDGPGRRAWRHIVGWPLLLLGIVGLFLPFLQGILFIIIALSVLAPEVPVFRSLIAELKRRYPAVFEKAAKMKTALRRRFGQP